MMAEEALTMHRDFPRWFASVEIGSNIERRDARWAAVRTLADTADASLVEGLVRLAFETKQRPSRPGLDRIYGAYREADDTFDPNYAEREMQVCAGAALALLLETGGESAAIAALSVVTASMEGGRAPRLPMDLQRLAKTAIERLADAMRKRPLLGDPISPASPKLDFAAAISKIREQQNFEGVIQAFTAAASVTANVLEKSALRHVKQMKLVDNFIKIQDEELQMLWWLIGARSKDLDCAFDAVPTDVQPLVFAKELADDTSFLPGPRSIRALLTRAGLKERRKLNIATAISAANSAWLTSIVGDSDPSPVTQPIHFAIKRHLEVGGGDAWVPAWAAIVGIDATRTFSALSLGTLFYSERLLALQCD